MTPDSAATPPPTQVWRSGGVVMIRKGATLPPRCVRCNAATDLVAKRRIHWHHPGIYLLVINIVLYVLVALASRQSADVLIPLCARHRRLRRHALLVGWLVGPLGLLICVYGIAVDNVAAGLAGLYTLLASAVYGTVGARLFSVVQIDNHLVRLRGLAPCWLRELPSSDAYPQA